MEGPRGSPSWGFLDYFPFWASEQNLDIFLQRLRSRKDIFYIPPQLTERASMKKVINYKVNNDYDSVPFEGLLLQSLKKMFCLPLTAQRMKFSIKDL